MSVIYGAQVGQGGPVTIACINKGAVDLGVPFDKLTAALQKCYDQHFPPVWGYPVKLYNTKAAKPSDWKFVYFDDADTAGALGYHDLTHNGQVHAGDFLRRIWTGGDLSETCPWHKRYPAGAPAAPSITSVTSIPS
jgi:hypothetical protein